MPLLTNTCANTDDICNCFIRFFIHSSWDSIRHQRFSIKSHRILTNNHYQLSTLILPRSILKIKEFSEIAKKTTASYDAVVLYSDKLNDPTNRLVFKAFLETYIGFATILSIRFCLSIECVCIFREAFLKGSITNFAL